MKKLIILITFFFLAINTAVAEKTAKDLLNPSNNAYDFTFSSDINEDLNSYSTSQVVDKVEMDVEKILGFIPRTNVIFECQEDTYGSTYCPEALAPASDYLAYSESQVVEHKKTITDYEQGTYQELTSTVRDFMDGYAIENTDTVTDSQTGSGTKNVGTVIDYQSNSTATKHIGSVIDVAEKEGSSNAIEPIKTNVELIANRSMISRNNRGRLYISNNELHFKSYEGESESYWRTNGIIKFNGGCTVRFLPKAGFFGQTITPSFVELDMGNDYVKISSDKKSIEFWFYDAGEGEGRYKLSGAIGLNGCTVRAYTTSWTGTNEVSKFYHNKGTAVYFDVLSDKKTLAFKYYGGEGEHYIGESGRLVFDGVENCPSGYIMNSDSTKCLKLEPTINEVEDSGWKYEVHSTSDGYGSNYSWYNRGSNGHNGTSQLRWNGVTLKTGIANNVTSVYYNGYTYYRGSYERVETTCCQIVFHKFYKIKRTRNIEKCNQYGEMVSVNGTNYCTYEYTYEEPQTTNTVEYKISSYSELPVNEGCYNNVSDSNPDKCNMNFSSMSNKYGIVTNTTGWTKVSLVCVESYMFGLSWCWEFLRKGSVETTCNEGGELVTYDGKQMCRYAAQSAKCPEGYTENASGTCEKTVNYDMYSYSCPTNYTPINHGFTSYQKTDPDPTLPNWNTLDDAVNSATAPAQNCKRTITYEYYDYNCPTGYTVTDAGLSMCDKTDPNKSIDNSDFLSQPCNSSTPPQGNCTKEVAYNYYEYACSSGYTPIDAGLTECTKTDTNTSGDSTSTLDDACNSSTPPAENCYKDISYKHYTYGCAEGYITDNYGLATCKKTDPNRNVYNADSLDDACNSATPPEGNCRKDISYSYYEYLCEGQNSFYESYTVLDGGLSECEKTDSDINSVNSDLSTACNSSTAPKGNCESTEYTCNSNVFNPVFVDNKWQCSTYFCNDENKCGYGMCESYVSQDNYMPSSLNILSTVVNSDPINCSQSYEYDDGVSQKHIIKYCENGYIKDATCLEKDASNNCIKFETTDAEAKCIQDNNTCIDGYEKINGVCTAEPTKEYYFHTYTCKNETNQFNENWELINDVSDPGCIDDTFGSCINFDESTSNCRRLTRSCSNGGECTLDASANQWKCTNDYSYIENTSCNGPLCDLVLNDKITYCVNEECPTANGVYEVDGDCKIKLCPDGTFESDGLCYTE